jgi:glycosyltransferase involved in cell wall biosynthesis
VAGDVLVVDSYSTDDTVDQATRLGARVIQHAWKNHASQMNWAMQHGGIATEWVMRLDADEFLDETLIDSLERRLAEADGSIGGFEVNRRIRFLGQDIRHGGMAPMWIVRVWRNGWANFEDRWMDEHLVLSKGEVAQLPGLIVDANLQSLTWWTQKHNYYANLEVVDSLDQKYRLGMADAALAGHNRQAHIKRWLKTRVYARLPLGVRPWLYFFYRMVLRGGVLDGSRGAMFHVLQGLWYRSLVDAKVREVEDTMEQAGCDVREAARRTLGIDLNVPRGTTLAREALSVEP